MFCGDTPLPELSLTVTSGILAQSLSATDTRRQIAINAPSPDLAAKLSTASATKPITLRIGGLLTLVVGDTHSIWRAHNVHRPADFDRLYEFLANYPSARMRFLCDVLE
jgi:hypothetical protein